MKGTSNDVARDPNQRKGVRYGCRSQDDPDDGSVDPFARPAISLESDRPNAIARSPRSGAANRAGGANVAKIATIPSV